MVWRSKGLLWLGVYFFLLSIWVPSVSFAQVPGPADVSRIKKGEPAIPFEERMRQEDVAVPPAPAQLIQAPEETKSIKLTLKGVKFEGVTAFSPESLRDMYAADIDRNVTLDIAWRIAGQLKERYQKAGYFLTDVYVPEQRITDGVITIAAMEGYIGHVQLEGAVAEESLVKAMIARLTSQRPITSEALESFLLRMSDLPGVMFRAVLLPPDEQTAETGGVTLALIPTEKENRGYVSIDNYGSQFLGPHQGTAVYDASIIPLHQTTLAASSSLPLEELSYASLKHVMPLAPDFALELSGTMSKAKPGHTIKNLEVEAQSISASATLRYQALRQRRENLALRLVFDATRTDSDTLGVALVREKSRALRAGVEYAFADTWLGQNSLDFSVSRGLGILGASEEGELNLSRAQGVPDFTKVNLSLSRIQGITDNWMAIAAFSGQAATDPLFTSEEFGYGGQSFGRAYDASEIIGDGGVSGSLEIRYGGWRDAGTITPMPYVFYDIGKVWSEGTGQPSASASAAGLGVRFSAPAEIQGNVGVAFPLTRPADNPIYGVGRQGPRLLLQVSKNF